MTTMKKHTMIEKIRSKTGFICDMDGVIYHGNRLLDGVKEFVAWYCQVYPIKIPLMNLPTAPIIS
jgi:ribonucleotide monophosphatase NagD (HAD superfamily)